jgi:P-type conjugative transfer protein TrbJ
MISRRPVAALWLAALVCMAGPAVAGSYCDYSNILDPDALIKNTIQAEEGVVATTQLAQRYATKIQQYKTQLLQLKKLGQGDVTGALQQNAAQLVEAQQLLGALRSLNASTIQVKSRMEQRLGAVKATTGSWDSYIDWERARIARNVDVAVAGAQEEARALKRVQDDYELVRQLADKVPTSEGMQQAGQLLNVQMNRLIAQQAELGRILAPLAAGQGALAEAAQQRAERDRFRYEQFDRIQRMSNAKRGGERRSLEGQP